MTSGYSRLTSPRSFGENEFVVAGVPQAVDLTAMANQHFTRPPEQDTAFNRKLQGTRLDGSRANWALHEMQDGTQSHMDVPRSG
ncbi:hypothetical protein GCM10027430_34990 [Lysobacter tyrosinilyticus]